MVVMGGGIVPQPGLQNPLVRGWHQPLLVHLFYICIRDVAYSVYDRVAMVHVQGLNLKTVAPLRTSGFEHPVARVSISGDFLLIGVNMLAAISIFCVFMLCAFLPALCKSIWIALPLSFIMVVLVSFVEGVSIGGMDGVESVTKFFLLRVVFFMSVTVGIYKIRKIVRRARQVSA